MIDIKATPADRELYISRLLDAYDSATPAQLEKGRNWYAVAHDIAAGIANDDIRTGAGVLAALSPQKEWGLNVRMAAAAFRGEPVGHFSDALRKCAAIMAGADPLDVLPVNLKTGNFFRNILDPEDPDPVTIDSHMHDIMAGLPYLGPGRKDTYGNRGLSNVNRYAMLAHCTREAAYRRDVLSGVLQATAWGVHRESKGTR